MLFVENSVFIIISFDDQYAESETAWLYSIPCKNKIPIKFFSYCLVFYAFHVGLIFELNFYKIHLR